MSPLIDCVFLLLIFFLVTSQLKRYERQIPVLLADPTASLSVEVAESAFRLGLNQGGQLFQENGRDPTGRVLFVPVEDAEVFLRELRAERGADTPIELVADEQAPFQTVIDTLDALQLTGFNQVRSRIRAGTF